MRVWPGVLVFVKLLFGKAAPGSANGGMSSAHRHGVAGWHVTRSRAVHGQLGKLEIKGANG
jgi:hypothetical protein